MPPRRSSGIEKLDFWLNLSAIATGILPDTINHHWTKSLLASPDGKELFVGVGSNSNASENGLAVENRREVKSSRQGCEKTVTFDRSAAKGAGMTLIT